MTSKKTVLIKWFLGLTGLILLISASGYGYLYPAIIHNFPDIDDYKVFSNSTIKKSTSPEPWPVSQNYNQVSLSDDFREYLEGLNTVALLVVKNDSLVHEEYWDSYSEQSLSNSFSIAKTYVSVLTGIALREGKIKSINQPVSDYIPEFKSDNRKHITIKHLLTMSSGLNWEESYWNPFSVTTRGYYGDDLEKTSLSLKSIESPGKRYEYRSGDTQILSLVLNKATGVSLSEYFEKKLWQPTGSEQDALWSIDKPEGIEKAYCCLNTNARDFARLGSLYLHMGNWKGNQLVDSAYVTESITPTGLSDPEFNKTVNFYGYSWWILPEYKGHKIFYARGILGQYVFVIPDKNLVIVRLGKNRGENVERHYEDVYRILDETMQKF